MTKQLRLIYVALVLICGFETQSYPAETMVAAESDGVRQWTSEQEYRDHIWKLSRLPDTKFGFIRLRCELPAGHHALSIGLDRGWLKNGVYAEPQESGAVQSGFLSAGNIAPGETRVFTVAAGRHEVSVGDDFYSSESATVDVQPEQTQDLVCGERFKGMSKAYYKVNYLFKKEKAGKNYYYLRDPAS